MDYYYYKGQTYPSRLQKHFQSNSNPNKKTNKELNSRNLEKIKDLNNNGRQLLLHTLPSFTSLSLSSATVIPQMRLISPCPSMPTKTTNFFEK